MPWWSPTLTTGLPPGHLSSPRLNIIASPRIVVDSARINDMLTLLKGSSRTRNRTRDMSSVRSEVPAVTSELATTSCFHKIRTRSYVLLYYSWLVPPLLPIKFNQHRLARLQVWQGPHTVPPIVTGFLSGLKLGVKLTHLVLLDRTWLEGTWQRRERRPQSSTVR